MRFRVAVAGSFALFLLPLTASAAPPYVDRSITLPRHDWAFDVGLGLGFDTRTPSHTGPGFNLEMAVGITRDIELGVRTGLRASDDARFTHADEYGRLFDRETDSFAAGSATMANPEVRLRGAIARGRTVEAALEGRLTMPFANHTSAGLEFGIPLAFHAGNVVRIDTGPYIPIAFYDPAIVGFHVPVFIWFQVSHRVWLGPMAGLRFIHISNLADQTNLELGFGLGVAITRTIDFKAMFFAPRLNEADGAHDFGLGAGLQFRIE